MSSKYLCAHGHFYQPPRFDPFTGRIPREGGAEPYHDFNEKINAECYRPNAQAGNFELMSFDLGPTLAEWLERNDPETYRLILDADRNYLEKHGHGNAIAQAYNHTILPLANSAEKRIQIAWGIADFRHRFGRAPEGMWLAETAVDFETLCLLAERGIQFTILAPWQAASGIDTSEPYRVHTCGGKSIVVFFFDAELSTPLSFEDWATVSADYYSSELLAREVNWEKVKRGVPGLSLIASDGEVYGHHKPFRDHFLKHLLRTSAPREGFEVVALSTYLHAHPPIHRVVVNDATSWSCFHGVRRWRDRDEEDAGDHGDWKRYLRGAMNRLAERIDAAFEKTASPFCFDPWEILEQYIQVKLGVMTSRDLISRYVSNPESSEGVALATMMESEYYRQLMFTSCGFYFEDLDRIEPYNDIAFAARAVQLAGAAGFGDFERLFVRELQRARSWRTGRTARDMYDTIVGAHRERLISSPSLGKVAVKTMRVS